ncbi:3993_t:CDS:2 [Acaulospora colombiana]|uniref:3993_t:CDS:1 n=1 Tax=Acaulospora colombiana TaxID=27376 RepID=A0ACA9K1S5_9GLOM|nr:3993_t:CDS:2 [Acaulospora colombiana]
MELHDSSHRKPNANKGTKQKSDFKVNVHTANTIRDEEQKRRTVFKAVLESPFTVKWQPEKKSCSEDETKRTSVNKRDSAHDLVTENMISVELTPKPNSIAHQFGFVVGINDVTKHMEQSYSQQMISNFQQRCARLSSRTSATSIQPKSHPDSLKPREPLRMIFVCKADVSPPHLIAHLPIMANIANVLIVPLPGGSSKMIADHIGISKATVLGIKEVSPEFDELYKLIREKVMPVHAPWLMPLKKLEISKKRKCPSEEHEETIAGPSSLGVKEKFGEPTEQNTHTNYYPTQIKHLKTTAPINKEKYKEGKTKKKSKPLNV